MTPPLSLRAFGHRVLVALLICCVLTTALWVAVLHAENAKIAQIPTANIPVGLLHSGGNYLIIGSDTRAFVDTKADAEHFGSKQSQTGQRSDTIMVAHIDPGQHTGVLVSFPRDLWVPIPGHGTAKINAAFAYGGAQLTIKTIETDFDIPISHYLEVDFAGFRDIVNAIGSVPIYFPTPARDKNSGLAIGTPGCHNLTGAQALAYVRSRYYQYFANGRWQYDPTSDLGRIRRQQYFIRSVSRAAIHTVFSDPRRVFKVVDKTVMSLTRDKLLAASDLARPRDGVPRHESDCLPHVHVAVEPRRSSTARACCCSTRRKPRPRSPACRGTPPVDHDRPEDLTDHGPADGRERVGRHRSRGEGAQPVADRPVPGRCAGGRRRSLRLLGDRGPVRAGARRPRPGSCSRSSVVRASWCPSTRRRVGSMSWSCSARTSARSRSRPRRRPPWLRNPPRRRKRPRQRVTRRRPGRPRIRVV